jgi:protein-L-isoaspartate(D-aspartate) O-methyltransferase
MTMEDFAIARRKMVDSQLRTEAVTDYGVLSVMGSIPREQFVPQGQRPFAYLDNDIVLKRSGEPRYLLQPAAFARLLQLAEITTVDRVLDIGVGTGYSAAVIAGLARSVVAVESDPDLAMTARQNLAALDATTAKVVVGSLDAGAPSDGPYDVIILEGSVEVIPPALFAQLNENGRLIAVVGHGWSAVATFFRKSSGDIGRRPAFNLAVNALPGFRQPAAFVF